MNWSYFRFAPWIDTRVSFVNGTPRGGALLDLGASDGQTLSHMAQLRPDLRFFAADIEGRPENYPSGCQFARVDLQRDQLPWPDHSIDAITCMHLVEHLTTLDHMFSEIARLLKPGGRVYFETPHPKTLTLPRQEKPTPGAGPMNFFDDPTHVEIVRVEKLGEFAQRNGLKVLRSGTSRNLAIAASYPLFCFSSGRNQIVSKTHWIGWSAYLIAGA